MPDSLRKSVSESGQRPSRKIPSRIQRKQILGLILIALLLLLLAFLRADKHALFAPGWWRIG
jgi:hypothetical protein